MMDCEVFLKDFYTRGTDEYLSHWANEVDWMAAEGWKVIECCRQSGRPGFWTVVFGRASSTEDNSGRTGYGTTWH